MKKILNILFFFPAISYSQEFKVDCGNDTIFCRYNDTIHLGTQVKLINGEAPYTYCWSCRYVIDKTLIVTAKTFLNDTTLLNPYFKSFPIGSDKLILTLCVKDSTGKLALDSITVRFSQFKFSLGYIVVNLTAGDSIQFGDYLIGGGIPPLKYYWTPSEGLSDTANNNTWCKPLKSTDYYQYAIDSAGCISGPNLAYEIRITPNFIKSININQGNKLHSHQVGTKIYFENSLGIPIYITLYSLDGKVIFESKINCSFFDVGQLNLQNSMYYYVIKVNDTYETGKFLNNILK